ncbi:MAG: hypothetical protein CMD89_01620 [Gammaproteobacteria bacterium]|nr:hypothetical protein [Gammaproteobacteria bacterium]|tara:strand:+ start:11553 stop:12551 length:999 start_codon:yes stop_codon:yes gene_type:complete
MKLAIFAAGTGGHIFPALSIAGQFKKEQILFFASNRTIEKDIFKKSEFNVVHLNFSGFRGKSLVKKIFWLIKLPFILYSTLNKFKEFEADKILIMGGYISILGYLVSVLSKADLYIHEQNSVMGTANKIASKRARKIFSGFHLGLQNELHLGNPLREEFHKISYLDIPDKKNILVLGGSQGSSFLIKNLPESILPLSKKLKIIFQTGMNDPPFIKNIEFVEFINNLPELLRSTQFIICRSGAITVAEIQACGIPAIFIPLANAVDNHQFLNAKEACKLGGGIIINESDFLRSDCSEKILSFSNKNMIELSKHMKKDLHLNSAKRISDEIKQD